MQLYFPDWSDLAHASNEMITSWELETMRRWEYRRYFDGQVFEERVPVEVQVQGEEAPLLFPVGINLVKMLCLAQADSLYGEWEDQIINFEVRNEEKIDDAAKSAIDLANRILQGSSGNSVLWEAGLDRALFGGAAIKITPAFKSPGCIQWNRVPLDAFFPVWDPDDPNILLEVYTMTMMTADQARISYGITNPSQEIVYRIEHWTPGLYETKIDGRSMDQYSGVNIWGFVPFEYIPNFRSTSWWGDALTPDIIRVQDELNMRVADIGESLNYNSHPIRWGRNLPRAFDSKNFPIGPNVLWDLSRQIGNNPEPEVGILEAQNPVPNGTFEHIQFLYDWSRTSSFTPPIVFGEDNGGGQRSGSTLEIRMWPMIKAMRRSRSYMGEGVSRLLSKSAQILAQKRLSVVPARAIDRLLQGQIVPRFAQLLPRDHQAAVDEVVKLMSTPVPTVSIETSQRILGRGAGEVQRIKDMLSDKDFKNIFEKPQTNPVQEGMAGKNTPQPKREAQ